MHICAQTHTHTHTHTHTQNLYFRSTEEHRAGVAEKGTWIWVLRGEREATDLRRVKFPLRLVLRRDASGLTERQCPGWVGIGDLFGAVGWMAAVTGGGTRGLFL